jgi:dipeptidyl aminopeptidase/acylaminoacyl peptidase
MSDASPFASLESFIGVPQIQALALSPDGSTTVLQVATLSIDRTRWVNALWSVPTRGGGSPVRLTRSAKGESGIWFTPAGDVLFLSGRPDADAQEDGPEVNQLWRLPAAGGEARPVTRLAGGLGTVAAVAAQATQIVVSAPLLHSAESVDDDARRRAQRTQRKIGAVLHASYPVRYWDHDLGPDEPHLLSLDLSNLPESLPDPVDAAARAARADREKNPSESSGPDADPVGLPQPTDLTPHPGRSLDHASAALTPDGRTLISRVDIPRQRAGIASLISIDTTTGERATLFHEADAEFEIPAVSHGGRLIAFTRTPLPTPAGPAAQELWLADVDGSDAHRLAPDWDLGATQLLFAADDESLLVLADENGRGPIFRIPFDGGSAQRLTHDDNVYTQLRVDRSGATMVALRSSPAVAPQPVRIDADGTVTALASPAAAPTLPGRLEEVECAAADGTRIRGWLAVPDGVDSENRAPLLLWVHGGPASSWNTWSWRWNPWLAVARGYAVLLPDPGLSTGYGTAFLGRGYNAWGEEPYRDLMAITDAVLARPEIDETRTAEMGGSFGGYMSNWIAGHTDRFRAIVTHASLWALDAFQGTTDRSDYWEMIFTPEGALASSPNQFVADITTPMLVIHGDRDYRVPIGESIRLWSDLISHHARPDGSSDHRYLYFPDENHWILSPQNAILWWETVFSFLAVHVLGEEWQRPANLG